MQLEGLVNERSRSAQHCWLGVSLALAGSVTLSTSPILANSAGYGQAWQQIPTAVGANRHLIPSAPNTAQYAVQPPLVNAHATSVHTQTTPASWGASSHFAPLKSGIHNIFASPTLGSNDLNLASAQANVLASNLAGFHNLTIMVGGVKQVVSLNSALTGAEAIAAEQVLAGGRQTIRLDSAGQAVGGTISLTNTFFNALDTALGGSVGNLTVAHGVRVVDSLSALNLNGNFVNNGDWLTASAVAHGSDSIFASSITNGAGGVIASYHGGGTLFAADPVLNASTVLTNQGTISGAGNLTINAPLINNTVAVGHTPAAISAGLNVDISTQALTNNGLIAALTGNVNMAGAGGASGSTLAGGTEGVNGANSSTLALANSGGTIKALQGNINLSSTNEALTVIGGDLLSAQLNLKAATGDINVNARNVTGIINASGDNVHIVTASSQNLGNIDTNGDPQFVSTGGNIIIDGTIAPSKGADLSIIGGGNILSGANAVLDTSTVPSGNGGNLTLIAGANVTGDDTVATVTDSTNAGRGSATGGIINLTGGNGGKGAITQLTTAGTGSSGSGGYIEMVAYAGSAGGSGTIKLPAKLTVDATGQGAGADGDIILIAGATRGTAISTGALSGGNVTLINETPSANAGRAAGVVFASGTSNLGAAGFTGVPANTTASISTGLLEAAKTLTFDGGTRIGTAGRPVNFNASALNLTGSGKTASAYLNDLSGSDLTVTGVALGSAGSFVLKAPANKSTGTTGGLIDFTGTVSAGTINVSATGPNSQILIENVVSGNRVTISAKGDVDTSNSGQIMAPNATISGADIDISTNVVNLTATATTGNIAIAQGTNVLNLSAKMTAGGGNSLFVTSNNQINLKRGLNLGAGTITLDDLSSTGGVNLGATITAGIANITGGDAGITSSGGTVVNAGAINLVSTANIGTSSSPIQVNNNLQAGLGNALTLKVGSGGSAFAKERGTADVTLDAMATTTGKQLKITAAVAELDVVEAPFDNVSLCDTNSSGSINLNPGANLGAIFGTGKGYFNLSSGADISMTFSNAGIQATSVSLVSARGNIGQSGDLIATTPTFFIQARQGNASVTDAASGNIKATGNSLGTYYFIASGNNANVLIDSPLTSANILVRAQGTGSNITTAFDLGQGANDKGTSISLTPTGNLTINGRLTSDYMILGGNKFTGDPILLGTVNINKALTADHAINMFVDQSSGININATVKANAMRFVTANAGANIVLNASLLGVKDREGDGTIITVQANNADVVNKQGIVLNAGDINLTGVNIGTGANPLNTVNTFMNLNVVGGSAFISNTGNINLITANPVVATNITFNNKGNLSFDGSLTASSLILNATGSLTVGQFLEAPATTLTGTTNLILNSGTGITDCGILNSPLISANTPSFVLYGTTLNASNNLEISNAKGNLIIDGVFSAQELLAVCSGQLTVGSPLDKSQSKVTANTVAFIGNKAINNLAIVTGTTVSATTSVFTNQGPGTIGAKSSLTFSNTAGNLTLAGPPGTIIAPAGGALTLLAHGSIVAGTGASEVISATQLAKVHSLTVSAGGTFTEPFAGLTAAPDAKGNGGFISLVASNLVYNGTSLPPQSFNLTANGSTAEGGQIIFSLTNAKNGITIGNGIGEYAIDVSGANGGTVSVTSSSNLTVNMPSLKTSASPGGSGSNITLIAGKDLLIKGTIDTHNGVSGTYGDVVLQSNSKSPFTIGADATALNGITDLTNAPGEGVLASTIVIANNGGGIAQGGTGSLTAFGTGPNAALTLLAESGNIGSATNAINTSALSLSLSAAKTGAVFVNNIDPNAGDTVSLTAAKLGSLTFLETNSSAVNTGTLVLDNIAALSGAIVVDSNDQTLSLSPGSTISTTNGNITLQNIFAAAGPQSPLISLADNSTVHASASTSNMAGGNVFIVLGAVPPASALQPGIKPAGNPTIQTSGKGQVTFGTTTNPNGSITADASDILSGLGRTLAFNTDTNAASQIVLGKNVTVTADPPVGPMVSTTAHATAMEMPQAISASHFAGNNLLFEKNERANTTQTTVTIAATKNQAVAVEPALNLPTVTGTTARADKTQLKATGSKIGESTGFDQQSLDKGAVFFAAQNKTLFETPFGLVRLAKDSVALIVVSADGLSVYDLHDIHRDSVVIEPNGAAIISLNPGCCVSYSRNARERFEQINPAEMVAYRNVAYRQMPGAQAGQSSSLFRCEFEIMSMVRSLLPLKNMLVSSDGATRKTACRVIKTAAILAQTNSTTPYQIMTAPEMAAYMPGIRQ
jgi:hypothetical protein